MFLNTDVLVRFSWETQNFAYLRKTEIVIVRNVSHGVRPCILEFATLVGCNFYLYIEQPELLSDIFPAPDTKFTYLSSPCLPLRSWKIVTDKIITAAGFFLLHLSAFYRLVRLTWGVVVGNLDINSTGRFYDSPREEAIRKKKTCRVRFQPRAFN